MKAQIANCRSTPNLQELELSLMQFKAICSTSESDCPQKLFNKLGAGSQKRCVVCIDDVSQIARVFCISGWLG
jgi:hypothetical protein